MEVSGLSHWDYVNLVGYYHKLRAKPIIDPEIYARGYTEAQIKHMEERAKEQKGFDTIKSIDLKFTGSLDQYDYNQFNYVMTIYNQYKVGMLPFPGCLTEQPAQIIDIMNVLTQLEFESDSNERLKAKREQNANNNRPK